MKIVETQREHSSTVGWFRVAGGAKGETTRPHQSAIDWWRSQEKIELEIAFTILWFSILVPTVALAQGVDLGGGTSMMKDLPFLSNLGSTAVDIMFLAAKIIGGFLAFLGVKNIGSRDWERAIPALVGGTLLFFLPQIITALQKMGGAS